jgi:poly(hydroxyalkanoate) depolymerase family esterase
MSKPRPGSVWAKAWRRGFNVIAKQALGAGQRSVAQTLRPALARAKAKARPPPGAGDWLGGLVVGPAGARGFKLFRPAGIALGERLPLLVMLHGCGQDAKSFALSTRMNGVAARERFLVLYPEQDRISNLHGCWNWFDTDSGRAYGEAALIMQAVDQVCLLYPADRSRVAVAGLSSGASMAAMLATRYPTRFKAVVMHSGIAPGSAHSGLSAIGAMHGHRSRRPPPVALAKSPESWPPLMVIQGRADAVVAASNGQAAAQHWAHAGGAHAQAGRSLQRGHRYPMTVTDFKHLRHTVATLVEVERLGHAWSGGAAKQAFSDAQGPDASRMAWAFVARQFRA